VIEFWCEPGCGAPLHHHFEVEEPIAVVEGLADFEVDGERRRVEAGDTILLPAGSRHAFRNARETLLRIFAVFSVAAPPVEYDEEPGAILEIAGAGERRRDGAGRSASPSP
jgi:quercetin dioxygenase-like cupin family protein